LQTNSEERIALSRSAQAEGRPGNLRSSPELKDDATLLDDQVLDEELHHPVRIHT
jgi:hypothetical protein